MPESVNIHVVMILGWYYPDSVGGTENYVRLLSEDLTRLGYKVTILAPSNDESGQSYKYNGISVYRYPVSLNPDSDEIRGASVPKYFDSYVNKIREFNPDIVHIHSATRGCGVYHAELVKNLNIPVVLTVHVPDFVCARGTLMKWGKEVCDGMMDIKECTACVSQMHGLPKTISYGLNYVPGFISTKAIKIEHKIATALSLKEIISLRLANLKALFSLADKIITVSKWYKNVLRVNGVIDEKIFYSPLGLETENNLQNEPRNTSDKLIIGYIGRFKFVKGIHILIDAVQLLPKSMNVELLIYGRADTEEETEYLTKLQDSSRAEPRIRFMGQVSSETRSSVLRSIDILAIPSIWLETGPYVLLEAFSESTPVLGSNIGGISELITDGVDGMLVESGNVENWASAIKNLNANREQVEKYRKNIKPVRKSIEIAVDMSEVYKSILKTSIKSEVNTAS